MGYYRIIYLSVTTFPFREADLLLLLKQGRELSSRFGITGLLVHKDGRFMQVIEGSEEAVRSVFASIAADLRHGKLEILDHGPIPQRDFPDWHMSFTAPLGDYAQLPNFTPPVNLPATGPIRQLLHDFLAEWEGPFR